MPNWCTNTLILIADRDSVSAIIDGVSGEDSALDFETILPIGERDDWYEARISTWGTKWNASQARLVPLPDDAHTSRASIAAIRFNTAWSPSLPASAALSAQHPNSWVLHAYEEASMGFAGVSVYRGGENIAHSDDETLFGVSVLTEPGHLVHFNERYCDDVFVTVTEPGQEYPHVQQLRQQPDPFRGPTWLVNLTGEVEVHKFPPATASDVARTLDNVHDTQARNDLVAEWLEQTWGAAPYGLNDFASNFSADTAPVAHTALFTYLAFAGHDANVAGVRDFADTSDRAQLTDATLSQWEGLYTDAACRGVPASTALELVRVLAPSNPTLTQVRDAIADLVHRQRDKS